MNEVRWGLLSTARINRRVIPAIRASERGRLVAVASRDEGRAQAYADDRAIPTAFGSYEAMIESDSIDAVYVSLPNSLHAEWTIRALEAGKHVLCEKPFAVTLDEVDAMTAAARAANRVLAEAFMYRHHPQTKLLGELVHGGRLGQVTLLRAAFSFLLEGGPNIRRDAALGGGALWDIGIYPVSLAQFLLGGRPRRVYGAAQVGETGTDERFTGQLEYASGTVAQIHASFREPFHTSAEMVGTAGRLRLDRPFNHVDEGTVILEPADGAPETLSIPAMPLYQGEIEDMHDAILDGAAPYLGLDETRAHVETVLALLRSAEIGKPVSLD